MSKPIAFQKLLDIAKPFTALDRKPISEAKVPSLRTAWVDHEYIWATNSHLLIRIKHTESIERPYISEYKKGDKAFLEEIGKKHPELDRLIPKTHDATGTFVINDLKHWNTIHELAKTVRQPKDTVRLQTDIRQLSCSNIMTGTYIERDLPIGNLPPMDIHYNCEYMLRITNALKKLKQTSATIHLYGSIRPIFIESEIASFLLLPVRLVDAVPKGEKPRVTKRKTIA